MHRTVVAWALAGGKNRSRTADCCLQHVRHSLREKHRFRAVPTEVRDFVHFSDLAGEVQRSADDVRARTGDQFEVRRCVLEEPICLSAWVLKAFRGVLVDGEHEGGGHDEPAGEPRILLREKRRLMLRVRGVTRIGHLRKRARLCCDRGQPNRKETPSHPATRSLPSWTTHPRPPEKKTPVSRSAGIGRW